MSEPRLPAGLTEARRTPLFDAASLPEPLAVSHRTTVWAELRVQAGSVHYYDLEGPEPRDERLDADGLSNVGHLFPGKPNWVCGRRENPPPTDCSGRCHCTQDWETIQRFCLLNR